MSNTLLVFNEAEEEFHIKLIKKLLPADEIFVETENASEGAEIITERAAARTPITRVISGDTLIGNMNKLSQAVADEGIKEWIALTGHDDSKTIDGLKRLGVTEWFSKNAWGLKALREHLESESPRAKEI